MTKRRKVHTAQFKFKVALEALKGEETRNQIASRNKIHPGQVTDWKKQLLAGGAEVFGRKPAPDVREYIEQEAKLYEQIGRLKVELEWLKKKSAQFG